MEIIVNVFLWLLVGTGFAAVCYLVYQAGVRIEQRKYERP